jgi:hypothetical protein
MRRNKRPVICQPAAVSGEEIAARVQSRNPYASRNNDYNGVTGSIARAAKKPARKSPDDEDYYENE